MRCAGLVVADALGNEDDVTRDYEWNLRRVVGDGAVGLRPQLCDIGRVSGLGGQCVVDLSVEARVAELRDVAVDRRVRDEVFAAEVDFDELRRGWVGRSVVEGKCLGSCARIGDLGVRGRLGGDIPEPGRVSELVE